MNLKEEDTIHLISKRKQAEYLKKLISEQQLTQYKKQMDNNTQKFIFHMIFHNFERFEIGLYQIWNIINEYIHPIESVHLNEIANRYFQSIPCTACSLCTVQDCEKFDADFKYEGCCCIDFCGDKNFYKPDLKNCVTCKVCIHCHICNDCNNNNTRIVVYWWDEPFNYLKMYGNIDWIRKIKYHMICVNCVCSCCYLKKKCMKQKCSGECNSNKNFCNDCSQKSLCHECYCNKIKIINTFSGIILYDQIDCLPTTRSYLHKNRTVHYSGLHNMREPSDPCLCLDRTKNPMLK